MTFSLKVSPGLFRSLHVTRIIEFAPFLEGHRMGFDNTHSSASRQSASGQEEPPLCLPE
jgi:hypothetical protein